jgi:hypothetical protein
MWSTLSFRRKQAVRPRRATFKPGLETLEDRWVPAGFAVADGSLDNAGQILGAGLGVGTDAAGNVYSVGYVGGTITPTDTDGYVVKHLANGAFGWSQTVQGLDALGNSFADSADTIAVDAAGNSYVAGNFRGTLKLGNFTITSTGPLDVFVEKLDTNGNVMWVHQFANTGNFGPPSFDRLATCAPKGIVVDHAGNVVVTGTFTGHIDMDPANPGQHFLDYPSPGQSGHPDGYVVKLDGNNNGKFVWEAQVVNVEMDGVGAYAIAVDQQNNVYTLGVYANHTYWNDSTANNSVQSNAHSLFLTNPNISSLDIWKIDANGINDWVRKITEQPELTHIFGLGLVINQHNQIYATGAFTDTTVNFDPGADHLGHPNIVSSPNGNYDTFIDKMDAQGHWLWVRQVVSNSDNWGTGIALDKTGNPYVTGYITGASTFGNILLTPASSAGNSYVAKLNPAGKFLCVQKSQDLELAGDQAQAISVDPQGFVNIVGTFTSQTQWPGLPLLTTTGTSEIFTEKLALTCSPIIVNVHGTILDLMGPAEANKIVITDDRNWGILVYLDDDPPLVYGNTLTEINMMTSGKNDSVSFFCPDDNFAPDLCWNWTGVNGASTFTLMADFSAGNPFTTKSWHVGLNMLGSGDHLVHTDIIGSVPARMTTNFGPGNDTSIYEFHNVGDGMPLPEELTVNGGLGFNDIKVIYDFNPQPEPPGDVGQPISVNIGGAGTTVADLEYNVQPSSPGGPGDPPVFNIPLTTFIHGNGLDSVQVGYHFLGGPDTTPTPTTAGSTNAMTIAVRAPISLDVTGPGMKSVQVNFDADVPVDRKAMPTLQMFSALNFHIQAGNGAAFVGLNLGVADPTGAGGFANPVLMTGSTLNMRLAGGRGDDVLAGVLSFDPSSAGKVSAAVFGGLGNDDLTLDLYGIGSGDLLRGLIDGKPGFKNTAHHTQNVRVLNCQ